MLIDKFAPDPDETERHKIEVRAPAEAVYRALWKADFGNSPVIKGLLLLRSLPRLLADPGSRPARTKAFDLQSIIDAGFGRLAEEKGREIVLGVAGRFWRPVDNLVPFQEENFVGQVPLGLARAVWNFEVQEESDRSTVLRTETRVTCGDEASRRKFRLYWLLVRPFSGLIRRLMLRTVKRECETST